MNDLFLDTSYLLALTLANDARHDQAIEHWRRLLPTSPRFVTTSYVLSEVATFLNSRGRHDKAVEVGARLLHSPSVRLIHVQESLFHEAWDYFQRHSDKAYSLTDCVSFVVMRDLGLTTALAFDVHFAQAGYLKEP
jgi:uncharacterized protein